MNVVMTSKEALVEVQGTGEETVFTRSQLNQMLDLAFNSLGKLVDLQNRAIKTEYSTERQTLTA